ncbi:tol-pal system YbgF family protein [candidate division CSSED10-310 bacterium]|uniref:Tol-pal system YbgF family protein n=1 Tax=candidate division CSSED10-310 bacterium TaxID=2855610 RepID=A0ABV6YVX6_UNCC1
MRKRKRITKKELKQDEFVTFTGNVIAFTLDHKQHIFIALGVLLIIGLGVATGFMLMQNYHEKAGQLFSLGWKEFHPPGQSADNKPPEKEKCQKAAAQFKASFTQYPRSKVAPQAIYYYGVCQMQLNNFQEAINFFQQFIEKYPENKFLFEVSSLLASSHLSMGHYQQAIDICQKITTDFESSPGLSYILLREGICYLKLQQYDQARTTFQRIIDEFSESPWVADANDYLLLIPEEVKNEAAEKVPAENPLPSDENETE